MLSNKNSLILTLNILIMPTLYAQEDSISRWKKGGVVFEEPQFVVIDDNVQLAEHTRIGCGAHILGTSEIGRHCSIGHFSIIKNCIIGNNVKILSHCVLENAVIEDGAEIGPFAHIEEGTTIGKKAVIGNFVEVKRSTIGPETKAKHLSYLGDATTGKKVNVGAGVITCNYNGVSKHSTTIEDNALIGSNNCLVAPIKIGKSAITGAGSTLTKNVPNNALAISRTNQQINKEGYASKLLNKYRTEQEQANS